jgi:hypothetical protein
VVRNDFVIFYEQERRSGVLCLPREVDLCPQSSCPALLTGSPDTVDAFGFIDKSLSLLGDLQRTQDSHIREQFEQQRAFNRWQI